MKKCKDCSLLKDKSEFYNIQGECKECTKTRVINNQNLNEEYYNLYNWWRNHYSYKRRISLTYSRMRARSLREFDRTYNSYNKNLMSKKDFKVWCNLKESKASYSKIWNEWKDSGFETKFSPSIDRVNNNLGYEVGNIQWLSKRDNNIKFDK